MAAEEAACSGGEEVREAELPVEEVPSASEESKETVKRVGEAVSDTVVVADGDSGDLSGEISNLEAKPDPTILGEDGEAVEVLNLDAKSDPAVLGEDGEAVESNAASGCAETVCEDGVDGGREAGVVDDAPVANGHVHPKAPGCVVEEVNGEEAAPEIAGSVEQKVDGRELEGMDVRIADEHDHTDTSAAESKVCMEDSLIKPVATDATELTEQEAINREQGGSDGPIDNGHTHVGVSDDCGEGAEKSDVQDGQSNGEAADANSVKPVEQEVTAIIPVTNGHGHVEADASSVKPVELEVTGIIQDGLDGSVTNGHGHVEADASSVKPVEQEVTGIIQDGLDGSVTNGHGHVEDDASSVKPVEQEVTGIIQNSLDGSVTNGHGHVETDASSVRPVEQEVTGIIQDGLNGSVTNGHGHIDASAYVYVADVVFEVQGSKSKGEDTAAFEELVTDHDRADISVTNGDDQVERGSDSGDVETKFEVCDSKEKTGECTSDATKLVRQDATTGEQGTENVSVNADSDESPTQILVSSKESGMVQSVVEAVESVHHEGTLKIVDQIVDQQTEGDAKVANKKVPGEEILTNGCEHVEEITDITSVLEPLVGNGQHDFIPADRLENRAEDNREDTLQGTIMAAMEADDAAIDGTEKHENTSSDILQGHDLSEDKVERGVQGDVLIEDDADVSTFQPVESILCSTVEVEKEETREHASLRDASFVSDQQQTTASLPDTEWELSTTSVNLVADNTENTKLKQESDMEETTERELSATSVNLIADNTENTELKQESDTEETTEQELSATSVNLVADNTENTELKQESDMEVFDGGKLCTAPAVVSALHGETRSQDLVVNDGAEVENSTRACDLGTSSGALTAAVAQVEQAGPSPDDDNCPADGTLDEICSKNANAFITSSCMAETEYVQVTDTATTTVAHDKQNDDDENFHDNTDITGNRRESQLEINMDNEDRGDLQVIKPHSVYLMKVPRFMSESHWAKIQDAQVHLDELTQKRDAINVLRQKKKALCEEYRDQLEAAHQEERGARTAHGDKKNDLSSVQSMIGRMNRANSIQEIDDMIAMKEKIIAHESISLKEEKRLLQDIKELKAQKKQLCSNMGSKAEMGEAFQQKEHIHEQHKILKKDSVLLTNLKSLEDKTRLIKKALHDERNALRKLTEEHQAAHEVRQKAYDEWFELKKEPGKKNKFFFMYRKDSGAAKEYVANGDMRGLVLFCNNQVESFMELWNKDDDFRRQYVESNKNSTLRRLGTSDGRKLGPDEVPPEIPRYSNRMQSNLSLLPVPSTHVSTLASEATPAKPASPVTPVTTVEEKTFPVLQGSKNSKPSKHKVAGSSSSKGTPVAPMPEREDVEKTEKEKMCRMEEELELSRRAAELAIREEELRQEKAAAEKERLRLEQKAKAKEAEERKRRKAEKAQERAEFRARKEAELMEKKKAKKDKTRGSTSVDSVNGSGEGNAEAIVTNDFDPSTTENNRAGDFSQHKALKKRPSKQLNKMEPMPLPLRNKGRRKMRQYIMVAVAAVFSVLALVVASKYVPSNFRASSS